MIWCTTCRLNKNMVDGGSYITIGDTYKGNKIILPDRWKGKGLSVSETCTKSFRMRLTTKKTSQKSYSVVAQQSYHKQIRRDSERSGRERRGSKEKQDTCLS